MSTKKIRMALEHVGAGPLKREALAEVEAIEKAAKAVVNYSALEDWNSAMPTDLASGIRTIQDLAEESAQ